MRIGNRDNLLVGMVVFLSCFVLAFVASSLVIQPQGSKAATGLGLAAAPTMTLSADSGSKVLNPNPSTNDGLASASSTLTASTNVPAGYSLALSATAIQGGLGASAGTVASPVALADNTWGYALASAGAVGITNGFDASYAAPTPSAVSKWANPTASTVIKKTNAVAVGNETNVYYGVKADISLLSGTYSSTVTYTATANVADMLEPLIFSVTPNVGATAGGNVVEIEGMGFAGLGESMTTAVTIDGVACTSVSISSDTPVTGNDTIYCTMPAHAAGVVDVAVTTWGGTVTFEDGYTYKVPAVPMQEVTQETCPTTRTLAYDVRDDATYWIQKMADGKCWMLTNLAYGGGGTNTYGDTKTITLNSTNTGATYTSPEYYIPPGANKTTNPTDPSTSTDGGETNPQYGYLYNWCAAMGAQTNTSACIQSTAPAPDTSISICPSGWRLPTNNTGGEFQQLTDAIGATTNGSSGGTTGSTNLRNEWLAMYSGDWINGFGYQRTAGYYWSSAQHPSYSSNAYVLLFHSPNVSPSYLSRKNYGFAVRCILDIPAMQEMTIDECTDRRTVVYDARDNRTYFVKKMADGKCWMLTNLAYAGGGTNTYGDTKTIANTEATSYTDPYYMIPPGANPTSYPSHSSGMTNYGVPSNLTTGIGQYGYLYNWCAAMGTQTGTAACANATTPAPNTSISICPSGWRLPTSSTGGEFQQLTDAIGATTSGSSGGTTGSTNLRNSWLAMYSGSWGGSFGSQGSNGYYWSSTQGPSFAVGSYRLYFSSSSVLPSDINSKHYGFAVRCVMAEPVARTGDDIQTVTADTCPSVRTRVRDARDDATYWVQKMGDGKCWMLTNLAYGGGGTNTYGDTKTITNSNAYSYTDPYYMIPTGSNRTTGTTDPSTSTNGTGQYGYLYNWCAAMGAQTSTSACANATTPAPNTSISICPSGWRLPTSNIGGEFQQLTDAIGATTNGSSGGATGSTNLRNAWLAMYSGDWDGSFHLQGGRGSYWSSTQYPSSATSSYNLNFGSSDVNPSYYSNKQAGFAVRCIAV